MKKPDRAVRFAFLNKTIRNYEPCGFGSHSKTVVIPRTYTVYLFISGSLSFESSTYNNEAENKSEFDN